MKPDALVDWLISRGLIDPSHRQKVVEAVNAGAQDALSTLESIGIIEHNRFFHYLAQEIRGVYYDLSNFTPDPKVLSTLSAELAHRHQAVPIQFSGEGIQIAIVDPLDPGNLEQIAFLLNMPVTPVVAPEEQIKALLEKSYGENSLNSADTVRPKKEYENAFEEPRTATSPFIPPSSSRLTAQNVAKTSENVASPQKIRNKSTRFHLDKTATPNYGPLYKSYLCATCLLAIAALYQYVFGSGNSFFDASHKALTSIPEQVNGMAPANPPSQIPVGPDPDSAALYQTFPKSELNPSSIVLSKKIQETKELESKLREMTRSDRYTGFGEIERKINSDFIDNASLQNILSETRRKGIQSHRFHPELAQKRTLLPARELISEFPKEIAFSKNGENLFICNRKSENGLIYIRLYNLSESRLSDLWSGSPDAVHFSQPTRSLAYVERGSWWEFLNLDTGKLLSFRTTGSYGLSKSLVTFDRDLTRAYYLDGFGEEVRVVGWDMPNERQLFEIPLAFDDSTFGPMRIIDANAIYLSFDQSILYVISKRSVKGFVDKSDQYFLLGLDCETKTVVSSRKFDVKSYDVPSGEAIMKDPSVVAFFSERPSFLLFNSLTFESEFFTKGERRNSRFEVFNRASCLIASSAKDSISLFDLQSGEKYSELTGEFLSASIDPSGQNLAAINPDGSVDVWSYGMSGTRSSSDSTSHPAGSPTRLPIGSMDPELPNSDFDETDRNSPPEAGEVASEGPRQASITEPRVEIWTDVRGVTLEAALVQTTSSNAVFKSADGKLHEVSFDSLSPESRARVMIRDFDVAESSNGYSSAIIRFYDRLSGRLIREPNLSDPATIAVFEAANRGDHEAEALVGEGFYDGLGTFPVNRVDALKWFVKSSRGGNPLGRLWIATMTSKGEIGASETPITLYRSALPDLVQIIAGNNAKAVYWRASAECYAGSERVSLGARQPKGLMDRAIALGDLRAHLLLGEYLITSNNITAVEHLRYASDAGCATAATALAKYYLGRRDEQKMALDLLRIAAVKNDIEAQLLLGYCCAEGVGKTADFGEAAFWLHLGMNNAIRLADMKLEARAKEAIRILEPTIGEGLFHIAATYIEKKNEKLNR